MAEDEYTLNDALNYVKGIQHLDDYFTLNLLKFNKSIKLLADNGDKENFKKMTDKFIELAGKSEEYDSMKEIRKNPLSFLEFICAGIDHGFTTIAYGDLINKDIEPGNAQKLLREIYKIETRLK